MDFLKDYWTYHSCYEIPRNYALWAGIGLLGSVVHRKVVYCHGDLEMHPTTYIGLIGAQGSSKSTCCSFAREFFKEACPELQIGPSRASPESLCRIMCDEKFARCYTNQTGEQVEVRPFAFYINEFKNFVGRSPFDMLTFLTDIYDVKAYDASTIARGLEYIINPAVNLLCCETPEWIIKNVKGDIISGGFGRRMVYVYETDEVEDKSLPIITADAREAINRCRKRLVDIRSVTGTFTWSTTGFRQYDLWYKDNAKRRRGETNTMMKGYLRTKHVQLFKVMMLLDVSHDKPNLNFTPDLLEEAVFYLDHIEPNMAKLSQAAGRNELLASQQKIIEFIENKGTWVEDSTLRRMIQAELSPFETMQVLKHLEDTEQLIKRVVRFPNGRGEKWGFITTDLYNDLNHKKQAEKLNEQSTLNNRGSAQPDGQPTSQTGQGDHSTAPTGGS